MSLTPGTVIFANQQRSAWFFTDSVGASLTPPANASPLGYSGEDFGMIPLPGSKLAVGFEDDGTYGDDGPGKIAIFDLSDLTTPLAVTPYSSITKLYDFYLSICMAFNGTHLYGVSATVTTGPTAFHYSLNKVDPVSALILQSWDIGSFTGTGNLGLTVNLAVSPDGSTLYMGGTGTGQWGDDEIARYDLIGEAPLSSWTTPESNIKAGGDNGHGFLMLPDGSLLVGNETPAVRSRISRFDSGGTITDTYINSTDVANSYDFGITPGRTASTFWCDGLLSSIRHKYEIRLSDGAIVGGFDFTDEDFPGHFAVVSGIALTESPCALHHH